MEPKEMLTPVAVSGASISRGGAGTVPGNSRVVAVVADGAVAIGGREGGMIFTPKSLSASSVSTF